MAQTNTPQTTDSTHSAHSATAALAEDDDALRKRLLTRIAVAGVAIAGLLGGLAVYDSLNKPQAPVMPKMADAPVAPLEVPKAVEEKPAEDKVGEASQEVPGVAAGEKIADTKTASPEVAAVPERTDTPVVAPVAEKPQKGERSGKPLTAPATVRQAAVRPAPPAAAPVKPDAAHEIARVMPERTRPVSGAVQAPAPVAIKAQTQAPTHAPASRPLTQAAETAYRFLIQVGVFSNHVNAEELMTRLQQAGIPAQIESRVQVGPFASRVEADAARAKLKSLGIDDGMLVRR